jgi:hypothetical protein
MAETTGLTGVAIARRGKPIAFVSVFRSESRRVDLQSQRVLSDRFVMGEAPL